MSDTLLRIVFVVVILGVTAMGIWLDHHYLILSVFFGIPGLINIWKEIRSKPDNTGPE